MHWYQIAEEAQIDSPSLLFYKDRIATNIQKMIARVSSPAQLIPHVKTNKSPQVVKMMLDAGTQRFKCATIAEAEMVAMVGGTYILIAHQLVGPKLERLWKLRQKYPQVAFGSLIDSYEAADQHQSFFENKKEEAHVFLDIDNGMHRSGYALENDVFSLYRYIEEQSHLRLGGLHVYDGHHRHADFQERKKNIEQDFSGVRSLLEQIQQHQLNEPILVVGGTPSFSSHAHQEKVYCSPGTSVLWDWGYGDRLQEQDYDYAALVLTRVISKPRLGIVTLDLGHKAIAAENPMEQRIRFLNLSDYELVSQSEEHGVLQVSEATWKQIKLGQVLYGVPFHVCPTVNLYDEAIVVASHQWIDTWPILGRKRRITV